MSKKIQAMSCPCGSGLYHACCQPFHRGLTVPATPLVLMRSRYSAYALGLSQYVVDTWHPSTRPLSLDLNEGTTGKWIGLAVKSHHSRAQDGEVEFVARYKPHSGSAFRLHERSRFIKEDGYWWYVEGHVFD